MKNRPRLRQSSIDATSRLRSPDATTQDSTPADSSCDSAARELLSTARQFYDLALSWHHTPPQPSLTAGDIAEQLLHLHAMNFDLWHHEDAVRRDGADAHEVAHTKRVIDDLNARRNAAIEDIDATLLDRLVADRPLSARLHTETPGMIIDRLSVLALRIVHTNRTKQCSAVAILEGQRDDLFVGFEQFLTAMINGEIGFKLYRQFKSARPQNYCALFETRDT